MSNELIYVLFLGLTTLVLVGGVYLKQKFNVKNDEIAFGQLLLQGVSYVASKIDFKYKGEIDVIVKLVNEAIEFIDANETLVNVEDKKKAIEDKALALCEEYNVVVDNEVLQVIDSAIEYFISK